MTTQQTGAPTDVVGGMPATPSVESPGGIDGDVRQTLAAIADHLIPAAHGMPSAADVLTGDRLQFVLGARPDLADPLRAALRPELGEEVDARLLRLAQEEPTNLSALQLVIVAGYYTDARVRELIGYSGQQSIPLESWPDWAAEGNLIDNVRRRGPVWKDPATGRRAVAKEGERDGRDDGA
jgi:hypothetical protein